MGWTNALETHSRQNCSRSFNHRLRLSLNPRARDRAIGCPGFDQLTRTHVPPGLAPGSARPPPGGRFCTVLPQIIVALLAPRLPHKTSHMRPPSRALPFVANAPTSQTTARPLSETLTPPCHLPSRCNTRSGLASRATGNGGSRHQKGANI